MAAVSACDSGDEITPIGEDDFDDDYDYDDEYTVLSADGTMQFRVTDDDTEEAFLIRYLGDGGTVVIPAHVRGYTVTRIWGFAFDTPAAESITELTLPATMEEIATNVFSTLPNLSVINVPDSGKTYYYTVRVINSSGKEYLSGYNTKGVKIKCKR